MQFFLKIFDRVRLRYSKLALTLILKKHRNTERSVVFAPSLKWQGTLFQRPHHLAAALARQGILVFYMEPDPSRKQPPFRELDKGLILCNVNAATFQNLSNPLLYLLTWNRGYLNEFNSPKVIYDYVDSLAICEGDPILVRHEHEQLLRNAHLVLTTAKILHEEALTHNPGSLYCPNGVDYHHFASARQKLFPVPGDLKAVVAAKKPIIGYYGAFAHWFDYTLVKTLAAMRPEWNFILIGPDHDGSLAASGISSLPNIIWLGPKPYVELPHYLCFFDVAIIPFTLNAITHATSPLKLFEYMAGGKPIVITPMKESLRYPHVLSASNPQDFSQSVEKALTLRNSSQFLESIDQLASMNTWDARAKQIMNALQASRRF